MAKIRDLWDLWDRRDTIAGTTRFSGIINEVALYVDFVGIGIEWVSSYYITTENSGERSAGEKDLCYCSVRN